jgi:polyisoprenyl-teichoic acid--peptidoglycan teichoic acid transferase
MQFITTHTAQSDKSRDTKTRPSGRRFCIRLSGLKRQFLSRTAFARTITASFVVIVIITAAVLVSKPIISATQFFLTVSKSSLPTLSGRTNFLLLGVSGGSHDGADLTDTMIFVSVKVSTGETTLISLPRDLWIPSLQAKINSAYHYGLVSQGQTGGLKLAKSAVSEVLNQPVHFAAVIDLSTLGRFIDLLGGLDVQVDKSFTDDRYPIDGRQNDLCGGDPLFQCRYETITFSKGVHHLDGATVIKFIRSRHSSDPLEGTDYARSRRQQAVLSAIKTKITLRDIIAHPGLYEKLLSLFNSAVTTDLSPDYYYSLSKLALKVRKFAPTSIVLDESNFLYNPSPTPQYDNQWILLPKNNNPQAIYDFIASKLN